MSAAASCGACGFVSPAAFRFCGQCGLRLGSLQAPSGPAPVPARVAAARERRQLTIMFCDLVGSTALSSQMDAEDFGELVAAYFELCNAASQRHLGYVDREEGDSLRVYFGYPVASDDDALRAVRAAPASVARSKSVPASPPAKSSPASRRCQGRRRRG
jgi:class 3 adenylate cyclase